jgi:hypothetical protein
MTEPRRFPDPAVVYVHTSKRLEGLTVELHQVLPEIIRDARELQAAAVMLAASNVRGFFYRARMSITTDRCFVEIMALRVHEDGTEHGSAKVYIPLLEVLSVSKDLPPQYGDEALGNPMCGPRIAIRTADRTIVVYCTQALQRETWFRFLEEEGLRRATRIPRGEGIESLMASTLIPQNTVSDGGIQRYPSRGTSAFASANVDHRFERISASSRQQIPSTLEQSLAKVDVTPTTLTNRAGLTFAVPGSSDVGASAFEDDAVGATAARVRAAQTALAHSSHNAATFTRWRSDSVSSSSVDEAGLLSVELGPTRSQHLREVAVPAREMAQFTLPPLALDTTDDPDGTHLQWRFKEALRLYPEATPDQLERIRLQHSLRIPGRWSEAGQSDPQDVDCTADDLSALDAARRDLGSSAANGGGYTDVVLAARRALVASKGGAGRVATANEILRKRPVSTPATVEATGRTTNYAYDSSPFPWIAFPWHLTEEAHMILLWRLAKLRITIENADEQQHHAFPRHLAAKDVPEFWKAEYAEAIKHVQERRKTIQERLGVLRVGRGYRFEKAKHELSVEDRLAHHGTASTSKHL